MDAAVVPNVSTKAMLVKLTTSRPRLVNRDDYAEQFLQGALEDESLTVLSKLFRDKTNPVNQIMSAAGQVYQYHKKYTTPHVDRGPRILKNVMYEEYTQNMRERINAVSNLLAHHMPKYDDYVQQDITWRCRQAQLAGKEPRAKVSDYPTAHDFQNSLAFDFRFQPLPMQFFYDVSDDDREKFQQEMRELEVLNVNATVVKMLKPLQHLAEKLSVPIGTVDAATGSKLGIFRDSAIENIVEGVELARKLCIDPSPELSTLIDQLDSTISYWAQKSNWLRESPINRAEAANQLQHVANQMAAFMQGMGAAA